MARKADKLINNNYFAHYTCQCLLATLSACLVTACYFFLQKIDEQLHELDSKYELSIAEELDKTTKQLLEKQILISVLGNHNSGKSTLLNSLLSARLACILCIEIP